MESRRLALFCGLLVALPVIVAAQPSANDSHAYLVTSPPVPEISVFVCPDGSGTVLGADAVGFGGVTVSATIVVVVRDVHGDPVAGLPSCDIRLQQDDSPMNWCFGSSPPPPHVPNCADAPTDASGQTTFTLNYFGGGCDDDGLQVWINEGASGYAAIPVILPVRMNSCDVNGDLVVNLTDIAIFSGAIGSSDYCTDFNWDGVLNLSDIVRFSHCLIGGGCP